jgi:hypothetical protein
MCVIISNPDTLRYSALGTFIDGHKVIFTLNAGLPQPQSDVGAGTSTRIINNQLKAVDFKDDIILWWKPGHWSNLAKGTASVCRLGVASIPFPHQHNWLHGHTYKNRLQRRFTHIHQLQDFSPSSLFPTSAQWWHLSISTCMTDWACVTMGLMNARQHAIQDIGILLVGKRLFIATFTWTWKRNCSHLWC